VVSIHPVRLFQGVRQVEEHCGPKAMMESVKTWFTGSEA
jgi:hypothetical protein